jgi:hypothetical protein
MCHKNYFYFFKNGYCFLSAALTGVPLFTPLWVADKTKVDLACNGHAENGTLFSKTWDALRQNQG